MPEVYGIAYVPIAATNLRIHPQSGCWVFDVDGKVVLPVWHEPDAEALFTLAKGSGGKLNSLGGAITPRPAWLKECPGIDQLAFPVGSAP